MNLETGLNLLKNYDQQNIACKILFNASKYE